MIGIISDNGTTDQNNMGATMATAAVNTIRSYFTKSELTVNDFDAIITGDLGEHGIAIAAEMLLRRGLDIHDIIYDCGMMIYDRKTQAYTQAARAADVWLRLQ